ncbi:hypothetical protein BESB_007190 [Besnoitia besnoiti]|uniref:Uncharacterized protein n=1 Tax=Besnoitia besnoiti TaxID=94643 RepID=A0A2A9MIM0_BESBE|nr:hypothetical protein BESB_007190 [Besnoitia besnoiti]PFH38378.1 hypothetical protein BESB_007190 [Besnoitia besnoiti]
MPSRWTARDGGAGVHRRSLVSDESGGELRVVDGHAASRAPQLGVRTPQDGGRTPQDGVRTPQELRAATHRLDAGRRTPARAVRVPRVSTSEARWRKGGEASQARGLRVVSGGVQQIATGLGERVSLFGAPSIHPLSLVACREASTASSSQVRDGRDAADSVEASWRRQARGGLGVSARLREREREIERTSESRREESERRNGGTGPLRPLAEFSDGLSATSHAGGVSPSHAVGGAAAASNAGGRASVDAAAAAAKEAAQREATLRYFPHALLREISDSISQDPLLAKVADRGEEDAYLSLRFFVSRERSLQGESCADEDGRRERGSPAGRATAREARPSVAERSQASRELGDYKRLEAELAGTVGEQDARRSTRVHAEEWIQEPEGAVACGRRTPDASRSTEEGANRTAATQPPVRGGGGSSEPAESEASDKGAKEGREPSQSIVSASKDLVFVWYRRRGTTMRLCIPRLPALLWKVVSFFFFLSPSPAASSPPSASHAADAPRREVRCGGTAAAAGERNGGGDRRIDTTGQEGERQQFSASSEFQKRMLEAKLDLLASLHQEKKALLLAGSHVRGLSAGTRARPGVIISDGLGRKKARHEERDREGDMKKTLLQSVAAYVYWPGMQSFFDTVQEPASSSSEFSSAPPPAPCASPGLSISASSASPGSDVTSSLSKQETPLKARLFREAADGGVACSFASAPAAGGATEARAPSSALPVPPGAGASRPGARGTRDVSPRAVSGGSRGCFSASSASASHLICRIEDAALLRALHRLKPGEAFDEVRLVKRRGSAADEKSERDEFCLVWRTRDAFSVRADKQAAESAARDDSGRCAGCREKKTLGTRSEEDRLARARTATKGGTARRGEDCERREQLAETRASLSFGAPAPWSPSGAVPTGPAFGESGDDAASFWRSARPGRQRGGAEPRSASAARDPDRSRWAEDGDDWSGDLLPWPFVCDFSALPPPPGLASCRQAPLGFTRGRASQSRSAAQYGADSPRAREAEEGRGEDEEGSHGEEDDRFFSGREDEERSCVSFPRRRGEQRRRRSSASFSGASETSLALLDVADERDAELLNDFVLFFYVINLPSEVPLPLSPAPSASSSFFALQDAAAPPRDSAAARQDNSNASPSPPIVFFPGKASRQNAEEPSRADACEDGARGDADEQQRRASFFSIPDDASACRRDSWRDTGAAAGASDGETETASEACASEACASEACASEACASEACASERGASGDRGGGFACGCEEDTVGARGVRPRRGYRRSDGILIRAFQREPEKRVGLLAVDVSCLARPSASFASSSFSSLPSAFASPFSCASPGNRKAAYAFRAERRGEASLRKAKQPGDLESAEDEEDGDAEDTGSDCSSCYDFVSLPDDEGEAERGTLESPSLVWSESEREDDGDERSLPGGWKHEDDLEARRGRTGAERRTRAEQTAEEKACEKLAEALFATCCSAGLDSLCICLTDKGRRVPLGCRTISLSDVPRLPSLLALWRQQLVNPLLSLPPRARAASPPPPSPSSQSSPPLSPASSPSFASSQSFGSSSPPASSSSASPPAASFARSALSTAASTSCVSARSPSHSSPSSGMSSSPLPASRFSSSPRASRVTSRASSPAESSASSLSARSLRSPFAEPRPGSSG